MHIDINIIDMPSIAMVLLECGMILFEHAQCQAVLCQDELHMLQTPCMHLDTSTTEIMHFVTENIVHKPKVLGEL